VYVVALIAALAVRWWMTPPEIPRPDLAGADPELIRVIDNAEAAVRRAPRSAEAWGELGLLLSAHRYAPQAEACFDRAAELDRDEWQWLYAKALSQTKDRPDQAIATLRDAIVRDSAAEPAKLLRGELCALLGRNEEAERQFRDVLKSSPENARAQVGLARLSYAAGKYEEARELLELLRHHPNERRSARELMAQIHQRTGDEEAAQRLALEASKLPADVPWSDDPLAARMESLRVGKTHYLKRITELREAGDVEEANALSQEAEQRYPGLYHVVEASLRMDRGDAAGAEQALRQALDLDPGSLETQLELGKALAAQGKSRQAEQRLRELLGREPSYGPAWLELGRTLHDQPEEAIAALETAVRYMPRSPEAHESLGDSLKKAGRHSEAAIHTSFARELRDRKSPGGSPY
jgi:tetratricopeptide (TPR) repeat protein